MWCNVCLFRCFFICLQPCFCCIFIFMSHIFTHKIQEWYLDNGRDLPWRNTRDPYRIWVSEIILQQTRVVQGMSYYHRFLEAFPDVESLASAHEDQVLLLWQGLGYYSRARNMLCAARQIVEMGGFPEDYGQILSLKGVGEYTAAAIASFAFDIPKAVVDGNVLRILSRYFGIETPINSSAAHREFRTLAQEMLDIRHPALYNQAIMDFGALQCVPKSADCLCCPLSDSCHAFLNKKVHLLPRKTKPVKIKSRYFTYFYITNPRNEILIQQRKERDIWQHLYQLPVVESSHTLSHAEICALFPQSTITLLVAPVRHQLTHQRIEAQCIGLECVPHKTLPFSGIWVPQHSIQEYVFPQLLIRILERIFTDGKGG